MVIGHWTRLIILWPTSSILCDTFIEKIVSMKIQLGNSNDDAEITSKHPLIQILLTSFFTNGIQIMQILLKMFSLLIN